MAHAEMGDGVAGAVGSASAALLWLSRSLAFVHAFLRRLVTEDGRGGDGEEEEESAASVEACLAQAYEETLMQHHGLVVRSVFCVSCMLFLRVVLDFWLALFVFYASTV